MGFQFFGCVASTWLSATTCLRRSLPTRSATDWLSPVAATPAT